MPNPPIVIMLHEFLGYLKYPSRAKTILSGIDRGFQARRSLDTVDTAALLFLATVCVIHTAGCKVPSSYLEGDPGHKTWFAPLRSYLCAYPDAGKEISWSFINQLRQTVSGARGFLDMFSQLGPWGSMKLS